MFVVVMAAFARPCVAQVDLSGEWAGTFYEDLPHRGGMQLGDYTGLPLNEAGWRKAQSWDEAVVATHERQCIPHIATYALRGPATIRFVKVIEPDSGRHPELSRGLTSRASRQRNARGRGTRPPTGSESFNLAVRA